MEEEMSNRLSLIKSGDYCTAACFPSIISFSPAHCVCYLSQHTLPLTTYAIFTTRFTALTKQFIVSKYCQLALLVDDDLTP